MAAAAAPGPAPVKGGKTTLTADQALQLLKEGNRRFVSDMPATGPISRIRRLEIAKGQAPFAVLVSCSDSRVGPNNCSDAALGELFIVRNAATQPPRTKRWAASNMASGCSARR
jgi:carbonic anhydrase